MTRQEQQELDNRAARIHAEIVALDAIDQRGMSRTELKALGQRATALHAEAEAILRQGGLWTEGKV